MKPYLEVNTYHILNGDALSDRFPSQISGEKIICREFLVTGPKVGDSYTDILEERLSFVNSNFGIEADEYREKVINELLKLENIRDGSEVNLWFEEDLFCQVNMWFVVSMLMALGIHLNINYVRPLESQPYSFGHHSKEELLSIYDRRIGILDPYSFVAIWDALQLGHIDILNDWAASQSQYRNYVTHAINWLLGIMTPDFDQRKDVQQLRNIVDGMDNPDFGEVFKAFHSQYPHYGYGDMQVKYLLDKMDFF